MLFASALFMPSPSFSDMVDSTANRASQAGHIGPDVSVPAAPAPLTRMRQKRAQVARACEGCRLQRIKCDNRTPCANCHAKGRQCINGEARGASEAQARAQTEISLLKLRIETLESELVAERSKPRNEVPDSSSGSSFEPSPSPFPTQTWKQRQNWDGVKLCPARSCHDSWFGPSSLYYFLKRFNVPSNNVLQKSQAADRTLLGTKKPPPGPVPVAESRAAPAPAEIDLTPMQEQYYIDLYWHSVHTSMQPVIDETEFKSHHQSLWTEWGSSRKPSPLVDIVLAICMQLGPSATPGANGADNTDASLAGQAHYHRCQALLAQQMESPSRTTLQCHILSAAYLCFSSFHNMCDSTIALAVRTAYMLGLHQEAPPETPPKEVEMRRRLWWAVYNLDAYIGIKLGRPFSIPDSLVLPELPSDSIEAATLSGSHFPPIGKDATWLSLQLQIGRLHLAAREAYTAQFNRETHLPPGRTIWDDTNFLEDHAEYLLAHTRKLDDFVEGVPSCLQMQRRDGGKPFSADCSTLELGGATPMWLQRQRISLETRYHNLSAILFRSFISCQAQPQPGGAAEKLAKRCAVHCIALIKVVHQASVASGLALTSGPEAFHWTWNVTMTLVGFVLAFPDWPMTTAAREAITTAVSVLDMFEANLPVAVNAAASLREIKERLDRMPATKQRGPHVQCGLPPKKDVSDDVFLSLPEQTFEASVSDLTLADNTWDGMDLDLTEMAMDVDFWHAMESLWPQQENHSSAQYPLLM